MNSCITFKDLVSIVATGTLFDGTWSLILTQFCCQAVDCDLLRCFLRGGLAALLENNHNSVLIEFVADMRYQYLLWKKGIRRISNPFQFGERARMPCRSRSRLRGSDCTSSTELEKKYIVDLRQTNGRATRSQKLAEPKHNTRLRVTCSASARVDARLNNRARTACGASTIPLGQVCQWHQRPW